MNDEGYFDFESLSEEEEKLDFGRLKTCPSCKKPVASDATICYFCGSDLE